MSSMSFGWDPDQLDGCPRGPRCVLCCGLVVMGKSGTAPFYLWNQSSSFTANPNQKNRTWPSRTPINFDKDSLNHRVSGLAYASMPGYQDPNFNICHLAQA